VIGYPRIASERRGGDVDENAAYPATSADELLMLDAALDDLARVNARQAVMVESTRLRAESTSVQKQSASAKPE